MDKKTNWVGVISKFIVLVLVFAAGFAIGADYAGKETTAPAGQAGTASITLDFGDRETTEIPETVVSAGDSVFDLLINSGADVEFRDFGGDLGIFIESINGVGKRQEDEGKWWQFWVNGEYAQTSASSIGVNPGDEILFKFTGEYND